MEFPTTVGTPGFRLECHEGDVFSIGNIRYYPQMVNKNECSSEQLVATVRREERERMHRDRREAVLHYCDDGDRHGVMLIYHEEEPIG